jgi:hypothetical protein
MQASSTGTARVSLKSTLHFRALRLLSTIPKFRLRTADTYRYSSTMGLSFAVQELNCSLLLSLSSSVLFSIGSTFLASYIFAVAATDGGQDLLQAKAPKILILIGYSALAAHTFPEILLDYNSTRLFDHSRYGKDTPKLNGANSVFFLLGSSLQCMAFLVNLSENTQDTNLYVTLNSVASVLWIGSAVATCLSRGCCLFRCGPCPDTFDQIANGIYVLSAGLWGLAALNVYDGSDQAFSGDSFYDFVFLMWGVIGLMYLAADLQRYWQPPSDIFSVDTRPLATADEESIGIEVAKDVELRRCASV